MGKLHGAHYEYIQFTKDRQYLNTLRPRQNGRRFADDTFKCIFLNENVRISIKISLKFVPKVPINNILIMVQIMAWRRSGDKPLCEPMMVSLLTHICVTRPQWVNPMGELCGILWECFGEKNWPHRHKMLLYLKKKLFWFFFFLSLKTYGLPCQLVGHHGESWSLDNKNFCSFLKENIF